MPPKKASYFAWYDKLAEFNVESLFVRPRVAGPPRTVFLNEDLPPDYYDKKQRVKKEHVYITNQVVTSKYTVITFLPRNLLEQFRRVANVFFLAIAILQFFSEFSTISPGLVILPLIVVILITALKDGYEDIKRHQSDRRVNYSQTRVLSGGDWVNPNMMGQKSKTFVRAIIPKSRKGKKVKQGTTDTTQDAGAAEASAHPPDALEPQLTHEVEFDDNVDQEEGHHFHLHHTDQPVRPHWKKTNWEDIRVGDFVKIKNEEAFPADILICATSEDENVCYVETKNLDGETNLKSRDAISGLTHLRSAAVCADKSQASFHVDCESPQPDLYRLNATVKTPTDSFPVSAQTVLLRGTVLKNTDWVIGVVLFTGEDTKIVQNSGGTPSKRSKVERQMNPQVFFNLVLLACMAVACGIVDSILEKRDFPEGAPWLFGATLSDDNPSIDGLITWAFALITFQNIIPISLYISIEFVRTIQAAFIYFDSDIYYEKTKSPTLARSWNLADDLGQIEYIFSDKTGTLTQNVMVFRRCSVGGKIYAGAQSTEEEEAPVDEVRLSAASGSGSLSTGPKEGDQETKVPDPTEADGVKRSVGVLTHFQDDQLTADLQQARGISFNSPEASYSRTLVSYFSVLSLCHTVLAAVDPETNKIEYKAQSPDEAALVQTAADVGFVFRGRDKDVMKLQTPFSDQIEEYELLNVLDFTSARKRMSVILRKLGDGDRRIFLFSKGADSVIFERLKPDSDEELREVTGKHLDEFASDGLRTLTLAYKVIPDFQYEEWSERYHEALTSLEGREKNIETVSDEIEHDLLLLGATAIEDRLQDGVPEAIADLKRAGIKVWVATGDKLETAIAIGYSTNLIAQDSNLIVIRGGDPEKGGRSVYDQMTIAIEEFFPESGILEGVPSPSEKSRHNSDDYALRRINTGISSIVGKDNGNRPGGFVLVIEGTALGFALGDDTNKDILLQLAMHCEGVICCRVSPLQKALIVKLVKDGIGAMTLAIGDGANDVSMIQAADVGVGISGEEGLQAVNSSDYAIAQFRFLRRLLFVHGHWSYARNGNMIVNFFYKNILCIGILWWFQIYCGWSSQYVFEYTYLLFWNVFWSLCPVIAIGLFDRIADDDVLMDIPELYRYGREGYWFNLKTFLFYVLDAVYQSAVIFFVITYGYFSPTSRTDGYSGYIYEFSTTIVLTAVMVANSFNGLNTAAWTGWVFFAVSIGIVLVWIYTAIYSIISPGWFNVPVYGNDHFLFQSAICWLSFPLAFCLALAPRYIAKSYRFIFDPTDIDVLRYHRAMTPKKDITHDPSIVGNLPHILAMARQDSTQSEIDDLRPRGPFQQPLDMRGSRTDMSTGVRSVHRGFDFSTEEHGVAMQRMQSNLSEKRITRRLGKSLHRKLSSAKLLSLRGRKQRTTES